MEALLLFELPPVHYTPFRDPNNLKGEDKKEEVEKMREFVQYYQILDNPTQFDKRHFFDAVTFLEAEELKQVKRAQIASIMWNKMRTTLINRELELFKTYAKLKFMEKWDKNIKDGNFTQEMSKDLDKLTRTEKSACYLVNGIDIKMKDCDECKSKICLRKPKEEIEETEDKDNEDIT
jgi:hypothetical protein